MFCELRLVCDGECCSLIDCKCGGSVGIAGGLSGGGGGGATGGGGSCELNGFLLMYMSSGARRGDDCMLDEVEKKSVELVREDIFTSSF